MSYIEDFLELIADIPKDFIRNLKLIREIDEKVVTHQSKLEEMRKTLKSKIRNEKMDNELYRKIEKENEYVINLADLKIELVNECNYLVEYHLNKLNEKIENYEKSLQANNITLSLPNLSTMDAFDTTSVVASTKKKNTDFSGKSKDIVPIIAPALLKKKKARSTKSKKDEFESAVVATDYNYEYDKVENEPVFCICQTVSYGEMIKCDNDSCEFEWFHFNCMGIKEMPRGDWFCCIKCQNKAKKKKK